VFRVPSLFAGGREEIPRARFVQVMPGVKPYKKLSERFLDIQSNTEKTRKTLLRRPNGSWLLFLGRPSRDYRSNVACCHFFLREIFEARIHPTRIQAA